MYRTIDSALWTDHLGQTHRRPTIKGRLKFSKIPLHRHLRAFVFTRDKFTCQKCGIQAESIPVDYDGLFAVSTGPRSPCLVMDHIISIRNGGTHHPLNLQTLVRMCGAIFDPD